MFFMTTAELDAISCMMNFLWTFFLGIHSTPHRMPVLLGRRDEMIEIEMKRNLIKSFSESADNTCRVAELLTSEVVILRFDHSPLLRSLPFVFFFSDLPLTCELVKFCLHSRLLFSSAVSSQCCLG